MKAARPEKPDLNNQAQQILKNRRKFPLIVDEDSEEQSKEDGPQTKEEEIEAHLR